MQEQQYLPVNWTDGMKINKSHFIAQDNAFMYQLAQSTGSVLHEYNYGLLPCHREGKKVQIFLSVDNQQQVHLRIGYCRAITPGGYYLQVEEDSALTGSNLTAPILNLSVPFEELQGKTDAFFVAVSVNPYSRIPYGSVDPAEVPARFPFTLPQVALALIPVTNAGKHTLGLFHLPIGKVRIDEQKVSLDENYIPPCSTVSSHSRLLEIHAALEQFYSNLENYSLQIIQKILQKKQSNEMADIVYRLCENVSVLTATQLAEIKTLSVQQPPAYLVSKLSALARLFKNTLDGYIGSGKEELMNYCAEWCGVNQGELESTVTNLTNHQYEHMELNNSIDKIIPFTRVISNLFNNLARLEYIGKRKDAGIFVNENIIDHQLQQSAKIRGRFLAE